MDLRGIWREFGRPLVSALNRKCQEHRRSIPLFLFLVISISLIPVVDAFVCKSRIDDWADKPVVSSNKNVHWLERQAIQHLDYLFSKKVIDVISANTNDLGPLSLESLKKSNLSATWIIMGNDSSSNMFSEVLQKAPEIEKDEQASEQAQLSGCDNDGTCDSPEMQFRRQQRRYRREERAAELIEQDIAELEEDAIKRMLEAAVDSDAKIDNEKAGSTRMLMRGQITMARVYMSLAKMMNKTDLVEELQNRIKESERVVATFDDHLRRSASEIIGAMGDVLLQARRDLYNCKLVNRKLVAMVQSADERVKQSKKQALFQNQLASKSMPKGIHCLTMQLTLDYYFLPEEEKTFYGRLNLENPDLYHYAIFSDNVLAASVAVNSVVLNAKEPEKHVFHLATDKLNFAAMNMWFLNNPPGKATIQIENFESFEWLNSSYCPVLRQQQSATMKEYYYKADKPTTLAAGQSNLNFKNPKYLSMLNHLRFYLPQIYPQLDKILFLDDDVVVQKDLTPLWSVNLHGKVIGAVETCGKTFHRFDKYLNFSDPRIAENFNPKACGWAYGMNIFDLKEWRKRDITAIYHKWQNLNENRTLWQLGSLPPGLLTFYGLTHVLHKSWHALALGYNANIDRSVIENAAVIHFNGNLKPWLDIALDKYKRYWTNYLKHDDPYIQQCKLTDNF